MITIIGSSAFLLTFFLQLPQAYRVIRTKRTRDISLATNVLIATSASLWVIYGLMKNDLPIWTSNIAVLCASLVIIGYKLRFK